MNIYLSFYVYVCVCMYVYKLCMCYISHGSSSVRALNGGSIGVEVTAAIERERESTCSSIFLWSEFS